MASDYLRKTVADRRTGANLIGISVDTSNMRDLSSDFEMAFNQLEKFARETDELKINNEKKRLELEIEQDILNFKSNYLKDESIYNSQEKWDEASKGYEQVRKNSLEKIAKSKYLSREERSLYAQRIKNTFIKNWAEPIKKRNNAVIQERVGEVITNIDMITSIASMGNLYDKDILKNAANGILEEGEKLVKRGIWSENNLNIVLTNKLSDIESSLFSRKVESEIIYNSRLTTEQKKEEIKKAVEFLGSDERMNEVVEALGEEYNFDDYSKKYLSVKLKENYIKAGDKCNKLINSIENKNKREKEAYESDILDAINLGNATKLANLTLKKNPSDKFGTTSFLNNQNGILEELTNTNIENFYNMDSFEYFPVLTNEYINKISGDRTKLKKEGYTGRAALQPLYDMVDNLAGSDKGKKSMIYKHYGEKVGLNPYALYKGENDPDYIEAAEGLRSGKNYIVNNKYSIDSEVIGSNAMKKFDTIAFNFSPTNNVIGRERALRFIVGVLYNSEATRKNIELDTDIALKEALNDQETYKKLFDLSKKASEFEGKKIYRPARLRDPRLLYLKPKEEGQKEQTEAQKKESEEKNKKIAENSRGW